jgi:hypothetical protein
MEMEVNGVNDNITKKKLKSRIDIYVKNVFQENKNLKLAKEEATKLSLFGKDDDFVNKLIT